MTSSGRLSLAYRDLEEVPIAIVKKYGQHVKDLDLSNNKLTEISNLRGFTKLETLVLDGNRISSHTKFPPLHTLRTLWVNKNNIGNLAIFVDHLVEALPNLAYLSMLSNDACPNFFNGGSLKQYTDYRHYVISRLKTLQTLDDAPITEQEIKEALRVYPSEDKRYESGLPEQQTTDVGNGTQAEKTPPPSSPIAEQRKPRRRTTKGGGREEGEGKQRARTSDGKDALNLPLPAVERQRSGTGKSQPPPPPFKSKEVVNSDSDWSSDSEEERIAGAFELDLPDISVVDLPDTEDWLHGYLHGF